MLHWPQNNLFTRRYALPFPQKKLGFRLLSLCPGEDMGEDQPKGARARGIELAFPLPLTGEGLGSRRSWTTCQIAPNQ